jgi:hypothetical protein
MIQATLYKAVACQACTQLHFINISNRKLLAKQRSKAASVAAYFI